MKDSEWHAVDHPAMNLFWNPSKRDSVTHAYLPHPVGMALMASRKGMEKLF